MNRLIISLVVATVATSPAFAETSIFISMNNEDPFQTTLSQSARAELESKGARVDVKFSTDGAAQIAAVEAAIAQKASAIILTSPTDEVAARSDALAAEAGIPLVYMNVFPGLDRFASNTTVVSSNDLVAGRMQMRYLGKLIGNAGDIGILVGEPRHPAAIGRTKGVKEVLAGLPNVKTIAEATGNWSRDDARQVVAGWLKEGKRFKAIAANNDEMALGAVEALEAAGVPKGEVVVAGVDATAVALDAMAEERIAFTILQNAKAQGKRSGENALALIEGEPVQLYDWVPYELVIPSNMAAYR